MKTEKPYLTVIKWIVLALIFVYTAGSTIQLVALTTNMVGVSLYIRQAIAVLLTDGGILLWHFLSNRYAAEKQRGVAIFAQWACFAILGAFFVASNALSFLDPAMKIELTGGWVIPLSELIGYAVTVAQAVILFGTPAVFFYVEMQSPEHQMAVEKTKAQQILNDRLVADYKRGQEAILAVLSSNSAVEALTRQMIAQGYTPAEAAGLASIARAGIETANSVPVTEGTPAANFFGQQKQSTSTVPILPKSPRKKSQAD